VHRNADVPSKEAHEMVGADTNRRRHIREGKFVLELGFYQGVCGLHDGDIAAIEIDGTMPVTAPDPRQRGAAPVVQ
jgi:hypothetical protein